MNVRKKFLVGIILFLMFAIGLPSYSVQAASEKKITLENDNFSVETKFGIDGEVYYDSPVMIDVTIESKKNFIGSIRLIPQRDEYSTTVAYGEEISLSAGEAKTFTMIPGALGSNGLVIVQVLDEKEKLVYEERDVVSQVNVGNEVTMGILSDDYSGVAYLDSVQMYLDGGQYGVGIKELTVESFPEDAYALETLQYLLIDNFDTATLSPEQYQALKNWVNDGGVLILSLGSNYQNVLHGFQDEFLTGTLGDLKQQENTWVGENVDSIEFSLDGGESLNDVIPMEYACRKQIGRGCVVVLSFSMGMEPVTSSPYNQQIATEILEAAYTEATVEKMYGGNLYSGMYYGQEISGLIDNSKTPATVLYAIIFVIYIAIVGPILYVVLKKKNRREKIWLAIPVVSLFFTLVIFLTGFMYRINKPIINTLAVVSLEDSMKTETCYTNIVCPNPKAYNIQFAQGYTGFLSDINYYEYYYFTDNTTDKVSYDYWVKKNEKGTEVVLHNSKSFEETNLLLEKNSENNIGTIDCDITAYTTGMEGTITNNTCYDLEDVVISFEQYLCEVGDIKKGEQITIDPAKVFRSAYYSNFPYYNYYGMGNNNREEYLASIVNCMMDEEVIDKNRANTGYIWGRVDSYVPAVVDGANVNSYGMGVLMTNYQAEYQDVEGVCCSDISMVITDINGEYYPEEGWIYETEAIVTYSFHDYQGITSLVNLNGGRDKLDMYTEYAKVYAYNVNTGNYDELFVDSNTADLTNYLKNDTLVLKFDCTNLSYSGMVPAICAKGE